MKITFLPQQMTVDAQPGQTVLEAARAAGVHLAADCNGLGTCGQCKVRVGREKDMKTPGEVCLACQRQVEDGMVVEVPRGETSASRKKSMVYLPEEKGLNLDFAGEERYGVAVDIGTTTLVVMLWNMGSGTLCGTFAETNPQSAFGADVISRITYAMEGEENGKRLQQSIIDGINRGTAQLAAEWGIRREQIERFAVVGNTAMSHFFLGADVSKLAFAPFSPAFTGSLWTSAASLGLQAAPEAFVYVAPNIAGHVGSDLTAGIITTDVMETCGHLFIDIGTNGEMVLAGKDRILTCSTAAGPAFEGSSIDQGMRAAVGAIERVTLTADRVELGVIGDCPPAGICGSGIIDSIGELVRWGIIDSTGRILGREELEAKGCPPGLAAHVRANGRVNDFVLSFGGGDDGSAEDVLITQRDVRQVQMAKAAIAAGIGVLLEEGKMTRSDLTKISIAGAFGSYISVESSVQIGLLPDIPRERIQSLGNTAGAGAAMLLLSEECRREAESCVSGICHVELAEKADFQEKYMAEMMF